MKTHTELMTAFWRCVSESIHYISNIRDATVMNAVIYSRDGIAPQGSSLAVQKAYKVNHNLSVLLRDLRTQVPEVPRLRLRIERFVLERNSITRLRCEIIGDFNDVLEFYVLSKQFKYPKGFQIVKHRPRKYTTMGKVGRAWCTIIDDKIWAVPDKHARPAELSRLQVRVRRLIRGYVGGCVSHLWPKIHKIGACNRDLLPNDCNLITFKGLEALISEKYLKRYTFCKYCGVMDHNCTILVFTDDGVTQTMCENCYNEV
jgi:hypothetical protein